MRIAARLLFSASFVVCALSAVHAESFAEKEFPELKKPKAVVAAEAPIAPVAVPDKKTIRVIPLAEQPRPKPSIAAPLDIAPAKIEPVSAVAEPAPTKRAPRASRVDAPRPHVAREARASAPKNRSAGLRDDLRALRDEPEGNEVHLGYGDARPSAAAWIDVSGFHGSPSFRAADQQRSYVPHCGYVYHRFFDENAAEVDRPVRVCN